MPVDRRFQLDTNLYLDVAVLFPAAIMYWQTYSKWLVNKLYFLFQI